MARPADRLGDAAGLGPCRVPDAGALGGRRPGLRLLPDVAERYQTGRDRGRTWKSGNPTATLRSIGRARHAAGAGPGRFRAALDRRRVAAVDDTRSTATALGMHFVDIPLAAAQRAPMRFTFFWPATIAGKDATMPFVSRAGLTTVVAADLRRGSKCSGHFPAVRAVRLFRGGKSGGSPAARPVKGAQAVFRFARLELGPARSDQ